MPVVTQFPTANEVETTGWTDPNNAHADDGVYATAAPAKNGAIGTRWLTFGFDSVIPAGSTITAVKIIYEYKTSTTASVATMRVRAVVGGVNEENHDDVSEPAADTVITVVITADRVWTRADLLDASFKVTGEARRGNSNNAVTFSLDYMKVEVTYNAVLTAATGSYTLTGNAAGLRAARRLSAATGSYTLTGVAATLRHGYTMVAAVGTYVLTGLAAALTFGAGASFKDCSVRRMSFFSGARGMRGR